MANIKYPLLRTIKRSTPNGVQYEFRVYTNYKNFIYGALRKNEVEAINIAVKKAEEKGIDIHNLNADDETETSLPDHFRLIHIMQKYNLACCIEDDLSVHVLPNTDKYRDFEIKENL